MNKRFNLLIFCMAVVSLCTKQPVTGNRLMVVNQNGMVTATGDTIWNSPLLILPGDKTDSGELYNVLLPNRKTARVAIDSSKVRNVMIENDSIEVFVMSPDDEQFLDLIDSTVILKRPYTIAGSSRTRRSIDMEEIRLWDEDHYYPFLMISDKDASGYVKAGNLRLLCSCSVSGTRDILDASGYRGLILPPFLNHVTDSLAEIKASSLSLSCVFNGSLLTGDNRRLPLKEVNSIIHHRDSKKVHLKSIYSINKNSALLLCYGNDTVVKIRFDEDYPFEIMDYKQADIDGNGLCECVLELDYLYGDGFYKDLLIVPDTFIKSSFYIIKFSYDGMSGESEGDTFQNGKREWYIKSGRTDQVIIKETHENGTVSEKQASLDRKYRFGVGNEGNDK